MSPNAQEKAEARKAEIELRLVVRKMELEVDQEVRLRPLELEAMNIRPQTAAHLANLTPPPWSSPPITPVPMPHSMVLVPPFRETVVDTYFSVFERVAIVLNLPKDVWPFLLQCKLVGKAQEVCLSFSLQDGLQYELVKSAILCAYELVP